MANNASESIYTRLITENPDDPIRLMICPREEERRILPYEKTDPLEEHTYSPLPRLVHRYPDRVLVLTTDKCVHYCRFCFRKYYTNKGNGQITDKELLDILDYIKNNPDIREVLLSGGDTLTLPLERIDKILKGIRDVSREIIIRLGTRIPAVCPALITNKLAETLAKSRPLWILTHFNHPVELTEQAGKAIEILQQAGLSLANQSVLLKDVNDSVKVLAELSTRLLQNGIKPYYLLQGDLAAGTAHFRVNIKRSLSLYERLGREVSGLALPTLAVDLPGGGGKIPLNRDFLLREEKDALVFRNREDGEFRYPLEDDS